MTLDNDNDKLYESVHNYTKYKLVEMLINRFNDKVYIKSGRDF